MYKQLKEPIDWIKNHVEIFVLTIIFLLIVFFSLICPILTLNYIKILVWPFVIIFLFLIFKNQIILLILEKLSSLGMNVLGIEVQAKFQEQNNPLKEQEDKDIPDKMIEQRVSELNQNIDILKKQLAIKEIELIFERIYNTIFGTQIILLRTLIEKGGTALLSEITPWYNLIQSNNPILINWSIDKYLSFLIQNELIQVLKGGGLFSIDTLKVTEKGVAFIGYIYSRGYPNKAF